MKKIGIILVISIFSFGSAMAQLVKVDQEVFGMDCAPCAYGLERGLKKMGGLGSIKVSLNDGKAYLTLSPDNKLTLQKIQEEVKNNGFSARRAEVVLTGELCKSEGTWQIKVNDETFQVTSDTTREIIRSLNPGIIKARLLIKDKSDRELSGTWEARIEEIM
ncbi:heavy-metal-associated domain-containing protein [Echinicola marina]|uniref:Cation transport ATPase n=2 Tax=Echinicola TaxID=390846 RepID=L0G4T6_ECHVK|nr:MULTISPECIES: cation transporter [Echinicola]AGA80338.1 cation transport ATPase [Echinicola vietnamensis DSM 17526]UCS92216.1 heavy-metal-associated domain-containing protein [Echinicola marina]GGF25609.1 hypothetical protein GCM10011339_12120 [Echinicola rosea]